MVVEIFMRDIIIQLCTLLNGLASKAELIKYIKHINGVFYGSDALLIIRTASFEEVVAREPEIFKQLGDSYISCNVKIDNSPGSRPGYMNLYEDGVITYKARTLAAFERLIQTYNNPINKDGNIMELFTSSCPFCWIYNKSSCAGCVMSRRNTSGCVLTDNNIRARNAYRDYNTASDKNVNLAIIKERAVYLDRLLKAIWNLPEKQFTPEGWKYFDQERLLEEMDMSFIHRFINRFKRYK